MNVSNVQIINSVVARNKIISNNIGGLINGSQMKPPPQQQQLLPSNVQPVKVIKINCLNIKPTLTVSGTAAATTTIIIPPSTNLETNKTTSVQSIVPKNPPQQIDEFRKLFTALFEIKDPEIRSRVMIAINGTQITCPQCGFDLYKKGNSTKVPITTDIAKTTTITTATTGTVVIANNNNCAVVGTRTGTIVNKRQPHAMKGVLSNIHNFVTIPRHVIFKSSNNMLQLKQTLPKGIAGIAAVAVQPKNIIVNKLSNQHNKRVRSSSPSVVAGGLGSSADCLSEYNRYYDSIMSPYSDYYLQKQCVNETTANLDLTEEKRYMQIMEKEWYVALKFDPESKLLPIHTAALMGDINRLKRQVLVFEYRKLNLEFKSIESDGNTVLHYAAISTSKNAFDIVDYLIGKGIKLTVTNNNGDSVLQYAAKYCDNLEMFRKLLKSIDNHQDLLHQNDNGLPLLHIIVNSRKFLFAQALIESINNILGIVGEVGENCWNIDELIELYHNHISSFIRRDSLKLQLNKRKMLMLNKRDSVSGRTALCNAVRAELKDFVYLLLANYADPRIKDMNDIDCTICNEDTDRFINAAVYNTEYLYKSHIDPYFAKLIMSRKNLNVTNNTKNDDDNNSTASSTTLTTFVTPPGTYQQSFTSHLLPPQNIQLKRKNEINNDEKIVKKIC